MSWAPARAARGPAGGAAGAAAVVLLVAAAVAALALPLAVSDPLLLDTARAVLVAGPAAAAAVAVAAGRPCLGIAALAAVGGYLDGLATLRWGWSPVTALVGGTVAAAVAGGALGLAGGRLDGAGFLALSLTAAVGGGALVLAASSTTGGDSGLGPVPTLGTVLSDGRLAELAPAGLLHAAIGATSLVLVAAWLLVAMAPGRRWRATGGDRTRAAATGIGVLTAEITALAVAGALAGLCGALDAAVARVVAPDGFGADAAAVPLAAALIAGRGGPAVAAVVGLLAGLAEEVALPRWGNPGPLSARATVAVALALLALLPALRRQLAALTGRGVPGPERRVAAPGTGSGGWPVEAPLGGRGGLEITGLDVRPEPGAEPLVSGLRLSVPAGAVTALVGANGSGKSTLLRLLAAGSPHVQREAPTRGRRGAEVTLIPQDGGGLAGCSVRETLLLAARAGGRPRSAAREATASWLDALGLATVAERRCEDLPAGARRRLDLARALLTRPAVLLADEPLAGLDAVDRAAAVDLLGAAAAAGVAVVLAEHDRAAVAALAAGGVELRRDDPMPMPLAAPS